MSFFESAMMGFLGKSNPNLLNSLLTRAKMAQEMRERYEANQRAGQALREKQDMFLTSPRQDTPDYQLREQQMQHAAFIASSQGNTAAAEWMAKNMAPKAPERQLIDPNRYVLGPNKERLDMMRGGAAVRPEVAAQLEQRAQAAENRKIEEQQRKAVGGQSAVTPPEVQAQKEALAAASRSVTNIDTRIPSPPKGMDYERNDDGSLLRDEFGRPKLYFIPGGPKDEKDQETADREALQKRRDMFEYNNVGHAINRARRLVRSARLPATGLVGQALQHVGGTNALALRSSIETIKSKVVRDALAEARKLSASGASGFGQLNAFEFDALQNSITGLDPAQSQEEFMHGLDYVEWAFDALVNGRESAGDPPQFGTPTEGPGALPKASINIRRYNPKTGKLEYLDVSK